MLSEDEVIEIRILSRRGMSVRAIAREIGVLRNPVREYVREDALTDVAPGRPRKLTEYEEWLRWRV
jgi:transposase